MENEEEQKKISTDVNYQTSISASATSPVYNAMMEQAGQLIKQREFLSLPDTFLFGIPELTLAGPAAVLFRKEELNLKEFSDQCWMFYLRAYHNHNENCKNLGAVGRSYQAEKFNYNDFNIALETWRRDGLKKAKIKLQEELKYDGIGSTLLAEQFIQLLTGKTERGDVGALLHCIWQVKRKLNNQRTGWEMMLVLYGGQHGSGKSTALEALLEPIRMFRVSANLTDLTDERWREMLASNFAVMLSELSGGDKASMEELKRLITDPEVAYRPMRTNSIVTIKQNCSFFGSSNKNTNEIFHDEQMRRFYQVNTAEEIDKKAVVEFDMMSLWRSVDENRPLGYFEEYKNELLANRSMIEKGEPFRQWLEDAALEPGDSACATIDELYKYFREFMEEAGFKFIPTKMGLGQLLSRRGFIHKRHLVNVGPQSKQFTFYYYKSGGTISSKLSDQVLPRTIHLNGHKFDQLL